MKSFKWVEPNLMLESACFVASKSSTDNGAYKTVPAFKYSPSGVYCSSLDFNHLYERDCQLNDNASPCCADIRALKSCSNEVPSDCNLECQSSCDPVKKLCTTRVPEQVRNMIGQEVRWLDSQPSNCGWTASLNIDKSCGRRTAVSMTYTVTSPATCSVGETVNSQSSPSDYLQHPWVLKYRAGGDVVINNRMNVPDMFRLPVVDINKIVCTPSPFTFAGHADDPGALRPRRSIAGFPMPCK